MECRTSTHRSRRLRSFGWAFYTPSDSRAGGRDLVALHEEEEAKDPHADEVAKEDEPRLMYQRRHDEAQKPLRGPWCYADDLCVDTRSAEDLEQHQRAGEK